MELALIWGGTLLLIGIILAICTVTCVHMVEHRRVTEANKGFEIAHDQEITKRAMVDQARDHDLIVGRQLELSERQLEIESGIKVPVRQKMQW